MCWGCAVETIVNIVKDLEKQEFSPSVKTIRELLILTRSANQGLPHPSRRVFVC